MTLLTASSFPPASTMEPSFVRFEMILVFSPGGVGIQAIVAGDRSLMNVLLGISTVALMHILLAWLRLRSEGLRKIVDGTPIVIIEDGRSVSIVGKQERNSSG